MDNSGHDITSTVTGYVGQNRKSEWKVVFENNARALGIYFASIMITYPVFAIDAEVLPLGVNLALLVPVLLAFVLCGYFFLRPVNKLSLWSVISPALILLSPLSMQLVYSLGLIPAGDIWTIFELGALAFLFLSPSFYMFLIMPLYDTLGESWAIVATIAATFLPSLLLLLGLLLRKGKESVWQSRNQADASLPGSEVLDTQQKFPCDKDASALQEFLHDKDMSVSQEFLHNESISVAQAEIGTVGTKSAKDILRDNNRAALKIHLILSVCSYTLAWTPIPWLVSPVLYVLAGKRFLVMTDKSPLLSVRALFLSLMAALVFFALASLPFGEEVMTFFFMLNLWASAVDFLGMFLTVESYRSILIVASLVSTLISPLLLACGLMLSRRS